MNISVLSEIAISFHRNNYNSTIIFKYVLVSCNVYLSGWPSGLRRQTQDSYLQIRVFWSTNVGVGSNPTSDTYFFLTLSLLP